MLFPLVGLLTSTGYATWQKIAQFPTTVSSSFFFDEKRGFIGIDGANGIKRTSDGGQTWISCTIPSGYYGFINDIFMKDSLNGWAGIEDNATAHGLWFTSDGGVSWQVDQNVTGGIASVYQTSSSLIIADRLTLNMVSVSTDGGVSFNKAGLDRYLGINFVDDLHGVVSTYQGSKGYAPALLTNDGGKTWSQTQGILIEAWGVYAQKGSSNFIIVGEKVATDQSNSENVYASTDYGMTWQIIALIPGRTTGHVAGVGSVMYVQSQTAWQFSNTASFRGLNRSTDGGKTWTNVGGPENYRDTRFSVTGCNGSVVYAFDESGGVWKTIDGGDGAIQKTPISPSISRSQISLTASICSTDSAKIAYSNFSCSDLTIESIGFSDSTNKIISTGALSFSRYPKIPQTLGMISSDSIEIKWDPKKADAFTPPPTFIKMHGTIGSTNTVFDTLLAVTTQIISPQPDSHPDNIIFAKSRAGDPICSTFVLKNFSSTGSVSFILDSAELTNKDSSFEISIISSTLPAIVAPQDSVILQVCFTPHDTNMHQDSLIIKTDCFSFPIALSGSGSTGLIDVNDLDFGSVKIGDTVCKSVLIQNIGLSVFTLLQSILSDTINFSVNKIFVNAVIAVGTSFPVKVCFHPKAEASFNAGIDWVTDLQPVFSHSVKSNSILSGKGVIQAGVKTTAAGSFVIRPNPARDELRVELEREVAQEVHIEILDALGKKVLFDQRYLQSGMNIIHIDTKNLAAGIYVLRIGEIAQNFVKE
jgi:photosystem II stability/assembly factor-like uncharacterized protein